MFATLIVLALCNAPFSWDADPARPGVYKLFDGASGNWTLLGEYDANTDLYKPWCGTVGRCVVVQGARPPAAAPGLNFGVGPRTEPDHARYSINGVECGAAEAHAAAEGKMGWVVAVGGSDAQREAVLGQIPPDVRSKYLVCSYDASHWAMRPGFQAGNPVALYVLNHDGTERHHRPDGTVTPEMIAALREPDPKYNPALSPDLTKRWAITGLPKVPPTVPLIGAGLCCLVAFTRPPRAKETP